MINSIRMSSKGRITEFNRDATAEQKLAEESSDTFSSLSLVLRMKHIRIVPNVILQRKTMKSKVVLLVLPSCSVRITCH